MRATEAVLLVWTLALLAYAAYAAVFLPAEDTVSRTLFRLAQRWPVIPFALGFLLGHVFWGNG